MAYPVTEVKLNQNRINKVLFNMIISQHVFDSSVASTELADRFRVDGTLFGDTKLYHSFDIGSPETWLADEEAPNLLALNRNKSGITQSITMGVYKMIWITTDQYLSKQAFMNESAFADFTSYLTSSLRKIKRVYDRALINNKIGTLDPATPRCDIKIEVPKGTTTEESNRLEAQTIAAKLVVLRAELEDNNRDFNKLGYLRSYSADDFIAVWNVDYHAKITKLDLPSIFHKDITANGGFKEYDLPAKWFGKEVSGELTIPTTAYDNEDAIKNRVAVSGWYDVASDENTMTIKDKPDDNSVFLWAGDAVPYLGQTYKDNARGKSVTVSKTKMAEGQYYTVDKSIAFVLVHKDSLPFMSGFETGTEFWNGRSLTTNNYLIFGHNELEFLEEYPRMRVSVTQAE